MDATLLSMDTSLLSQIDAVSKQNNEVIAQLEDGAKVTTYEYKISLIQPASCQVMEMKCNKPRKMNVLIS